MKRNLQLLTAIALFSFICINASAQVRSWTKNGSISFNQTTGCGNCLGMLWSAAGEAHLDMGHGVGEEVIPPLNAAYVDLAANNNCASSTDCYFTRGIIVNDFQYSFPSNVTITITGIQLKIFAWAGDANTIKDLEVKLVYNGTAVGLNRKKNNYWPDTYTGRTYGSSTDLWGVHWTPEMISDPGWGYEFKVQNMYADSTRRFNDDWGYLTLYYTVSPTIPNRLASQENINSNDKTNFNIYPNPTGGQLTIVADKDLSNFKIQGYDAQGKLVFEKSGVALKENESLQIDVAALPKGIYLLQIFSEGSVVGKRFVKE